MNRHGRRAQLQIGPLDRSTRFIEIAGDLVIQCDGVAEVYSVNSSSLRFEPARRSERAIAVLHLRVSSQNGIGVCQRLYVDEALYAGQRNCCERQFAIKRRARYGVSLNRTYLAPQNDDLLARTRQVSMHVCPKRLFGGEIRND